MTGSRPQAARVLPFRRRQFLARRRRVHPWWALTRAFACALLIVGAPAAAAAWAWQGPHFRLRRVEVHGTHEVQPAWVRHELTPWIGQPLLPLDLDPVVERLRRHPWIGEVSIEKRLPDGMRLEIFERSPVALYRDGEGRLGTVDADGRAIALLDSAGGAPDLPLVAGASSAAEVRESVELLAELAEIEPTWAGSISEVQPLGAGDFRLYSADFGFPLVVARDNLARGLAALREYRSVLERNYPHLAVLDLRFERQIIIEPRTS